MARRADTGTTPRTPLNKERVLRAAVAFADERGIESLSMRRLAKELGVEAMSLYNHVANKDAILEGIIDLVTSEIELPSDEPDWKPAMRRSAISAKDVFLRHPWVSGLMTSRQSGGPGGLRRAEWMLRTLRDAGFSKDLTYDAFHILNAYLQGVTAQHLSVPAATEDFAGMATSFLQQLPADEYRYLVEHIEQHLEPRPGGHSGFELGLDLILDGLERVRDEG